jgi:putative acetyltransferase
LGGVIIREQRDTDDDAVRDVLTQAFGAPKVAELAAQLRTRPDRGAGLVADIGGELVGHVQLSTSWVDAPVQLVEVLVLSPLGVRPDHQRQGLGSALVGHALQHAELLGAPLVFLEGDPRYYSRLGFERASDHGFSRPSVRIPDPAFQVVVLPGWTAAMSGALVYNDTFWSLDCVGLRNV